MANDISAEIRDNYTFYTQLLQERKSIFEKVIEIKEVSTNNRNFLETNSHLKHINITDQTTLIVQVKFTNHKYFHFKLKCSKLTSAPFFRFDSDGPTHRNLDVPLSEQQVTTPHFHSRKQDGKEIAYKTDKLLDEAGAIALEDINLCIAHFCHESNIRLNENDFPGINIVYGLGIKEEENDPLLNVKFES